MDTGSLVSARWWHTATLLPNGRVLVAGGEVGDPFLTGKDVNTAELYDPPTRVWMVTSSMVNARF